MFVCLITRSGGAAAEGDRVSVCEQPLEGIRGAVFLSPAVSLPYRSRMTWGQKRGLDGVLIVLAASFGGWHSKPVWRWIESEASCGADNGSQEIKRI